MTLDETLAEHLRAIGHRDLDALARTVAADGLVLVTAEGQVFTRSEDFLALHREWFRSTTWSVATEVLHTWAGADLATCLLRLDYRDAPSAGPATHEASILNLVFQRRDGRWLLVQDQNTPIRKAAT